MALLSVTDAPAVATLPEATVAVEVQLSVPAVVLELEHEDARRKRAVRDALSKRELRIIKPQYAF